MNASYLNKRIDNIEVRNTKSIIDDNYEQHRLEIIKWYKNDKYHDFDNYELDEERGMYKSKQYSYSFCSKSIIEDCPELCYVIAFVEINDDGFIDIVEFYNRIMDLEDSEKKSYEDLKKFVYNTYKPYEPEKIVDNPIIDNRIVYDISFASKLVNYLMSTNNSSHDKEYLLEVATDLLAYQKYTCTEKEESEYLKNQNI